jgi:hypothetical protein
MLLAACGGGADSSTSTQHGSIEIPTRWASANANTLSSLVASSDEVFIARVNSLTGVRDQPILPASDSTVPGKPGRDPSSLPISAYELVVTQSFAANRSAGSTATFEQVGGRVDQDGATVHLMLAGDPPVEVGKEYLFFVSRKSSGALSAPPYGRLEVTPDGRLLPLTRWAGLGALQRLSQVTAAQAGSEIDAAR